MNISRPKFFELFVLTGFLFLLAGCLESDEDSLASDPNSVVGGGGNSAPTITGSPATAVTIGQTYSFIPSAFDTDGDVLTFSIENSPDWATFSVSTGELTGQPDLGEEGEQQNIVISVSDGQATTELRAFAIVVTQASLGTATLSLAAPSLNTDGTPFTDLAAFNIYFGMVQGRYPNRVYVDNAGVTDYVIENLAPGTYYFVATVVSRTGVESDYSNEVSRDVS